MGDFFGNILGGNYMPLGYCYLWQPELLWLHAIADLVIALAYFAIPASIGLFLYKRKKPLPLYWLFVFFSVFMVVCGLSHLVEMISIWRPAYYLEGVLKLVMAAMAIASALLIFPLIPLIISRFEELAIFDEEDQEEDKE